MVRDSTKKLMNQPQKCAHSIAIAAIASLAFVAYSVKAETYINQRTCPADFPILSKTLARDLPDYLNRVYSRLRVNREVMTVSQPELEPLPLAPDRSGDSNVRQIFLSVLERETGKVKTSQRAYWLLVVPTSNGWRLAMAFMRIGQAPPVDVSDAALADAASKWLRDYCDPRYQR
jgi:hypothetical protein